jgi:hypothetical protein
MMDTWGISILAVIAVIAIFIAVKLSDKNARAQKELDEYLSKDFSTHEIGKFYERYVGHLYEKKGHGVLYNGALNGVFDMGRDLIVESDDEVLVVQTKCWARHKLIQAKDIFQLFGTMTHFKLTAERAGRPVKAVFYSTSRFNSTAREVAKVLGVELKTEALNRRYPMVKCSVTIEGEKLFYLPFDAVYDRVKVEPHKNEFFAKSVQEAVNKGFKRAG